MVSYGSAPRRALLTLVELLVKHVHACWIWKYSLLIL
eukprot:COSAG05_NODE_12964_length_447_cov_0.683908_1_plen_36_part_01